MKVSVSDGKGGTSESQELSVSVNKQVAGQQASKGLPGFEGLFLVAALGAALVLLRRRK